MVGQKSNSIDTAFRNHFFLSAVEVINRFQNVVVIIIADQCKRYSISSESPCSPDLNGFAERC